MTFRLKCALFCGDLGFQSKHEIPGFNCIYILSGIYHKIELWLCIESLSVTQELFTTGIVLAPNSSSYVLAQPHTITHGKNPVN